MHILDEFSSVDEVIEHRELVDSGAVKLVALPTTLTPATLQRRLAKLISQLELSDEDEEKAKYHPYSLKVDVESLCTAYQAYQLKKEGKSNVFIGAYFSFCKEQQREFLRDGRERGKTFDYKAYEACIRKNRISVEEEDEEYESMSFIKDGESLLKQCSLQTAPKGTIGWEYLPPSPPICDVVGSGAPGA